MRMQLERWKQLIIVLVILNISLPCIILISSACIIIIVSTEKNHEFEIERRGKVYIIIMYNYYS